ncbi:MAG: hypothetical protein JST62_00605 [Bacteroidetes bacterium]|nr:hypothetical protein [Bacteroidota bacterium]
MRNLILILALIVSSQCFGSTVPHNGMLKHLSEFYRSFDSKILQSKDEEEIKKYLEEKVPFIRDYINKQYNVDFSSLSHEQVFVAGLIVISIEEDNPELNPDTAPYLELKPPGNTFDCLMAAVGAVTGIGTLVSTIEGATMATVLGVVKTIFSTYFAAFAAAWAVYEFGDCMNWW